MGLRQRLSPPAGLRARLRRATTDDGFSLIESVVALTLASIVFTAFAASLLSSVRAVVVGRAVQQAANVAEETLESLRSQGYDALAMRTADLSVNEPLNIASCTCYNPTNNSTTGTGTEQLFIDEAGEPAVHVITRTVNGTQYTVRQYVTKGAESTTAVYKRLTVVVTWTSNGELRTRTVSTTMTPTRSGLPIPDYKFTPKTATSDCVSPGGTKVFGFALTNNGARDSWTVSSTGGTVSWNFYADDGASSPGTYGADDSALSGATPTVGPVEPTQTKTFWAEADVSNSATASTSTINFRVTSVAYPTYNQVVPTTLQIAATCTGTPTATPTTSPTTSPTATPTPTPTATPPAQPTTCVGTLPNANPSNSATPTSYYLANGGSNLANTTASTPLPIKRLTAPTSTTLWNYSTDLFAGAGRAINASGTSLATSQEWRYQFANSTKFTGTGAVQLFGAPQSGLASTNLSYTITVKSLTSTGAVSSTLVSQAVSGSPWGCAGYKPFGTTIPFGSGSGTTIPANGYLSVTVTASAPALLAYDTTGFPAQVVLPVKSGGV